MNERIYRTEAIVLRRQDFGEADRLITLYTPGRGKQRVIAKGARKTTSRLGGHLELFTRSQLLLAAGRNLDIITQAQTLAPYRALRLDLSRISYAYYVADLLDKVTGDEEENRPLYNLLAQTLAGLDTAASPSLVVRFYELRLLGLVGYQPAFFHCAHCQNELTEQTEQWLPPAGILCPECAPQMPGVLPISLAAFKALRFLQRQPFADMTALRLSEQLQGEIEDILRRMIRPILERDLKSMAFVQAVRR